MEIICTTNPFVCDEHERIVKINHTMFSFIRGVCGSRAESTMGAKHLRRGPRNGCWECHKRSTLLAYLG